MMTDVHSGYVRRVDLFKDHAGGGVFVMRAEYAPHRYCLFRAVINR
jgi:hypothetical protein